MLMSISDRAELRRKFLPSVRKALVTPLIALFVLSGVVAQPATAATLKLATLSPEGSAWMKLLRKHAKSVEERTGGEVKFKIYPGGVMGDDKAVFRKMRVGQLHGAVVTSGGVIQAYPDFALYNLPYLFESDAEVDYVRKHLDTRLMDGLAENKFIGFGMAEVGFGYPMMQKQATSVAQMRELQVWAPDNDPGFLRAYQAFGVTPVPLPIADLLAVLQTGLIDSIGSPPIGAIALQWYTQVQYALDLPLVYVFGTLVITERAFKKLSPEHQAIVREELGEAVRIVDESSRKDHLSARNALTAQGIEWLTPSATELDEWRRLATQSREDTVGDGYISRALYDETIALLEKFRAGS